MPLTVKGKKTLRAFRKQYGSRKGTEYFYRKANASKAFDRMIHGKR